jgi:2-keto-3-deoxy-L-rhamnonate aldolase RhmA
MASVAAAARRAGKTAGNAVYGDWTDPAATRRQLDAGFNLLLVGGDEWMLSSGCRQLMQGLKSVRG